MKKKIIIILTLFMLILTPFLIKDNKKVKAETITLYQVTAPQLLPSATYNSLQQLYNDETGIFTTTYNNNNYKITRIYTSGYAITLHIYNETNFSYFVMSYRYQNLDPYEYEQSSYGGTTDITTMEIMSSIRWTPTQIGQEYIDNTNIWQNKWSLFFNQIIENITTPLQAPTITLNLNTIHWQEIENTDYYNIFLDGNLIGQTQNTQWVTIENGVYTVQACTNNNEEYSNSELSNSINQTNYNDMIGNGVNWFTLMSAIIDSQIYLMKSLLNYTIWDINFFQLFTFVVTIIITLAIIKFIKGW